MLFTINDYVKVKLTPAGHEYLQQDHIELYASIGVPIPDYRKPAEDADGWSSWQLWDLMSRFGKHIRMGAVAPFELDIEIPIKEIV
jgi:hypothetical protein